MRRTRRNCCKLVLCTVCMICIFHILLTGDVHLSEGGEIIRITNSELWRNDSSILKKEWKEKLEKNLTLPLSLSEFQNFYNKNSRIDPSVIVYGNHTMHQGFLTIGIPTVKRRYHGDNYLFTTISSLISNIDNVHDVIIVIYVADFDDSWNNYMANKVYTEFKPHFDDGLMQVIKAPVNIYPDFSILDKTKHDSAERVRWRSKQNIDFAFLMLYCQNISQYYIQLEDDVIAATGLLEDIVQFVSNHSSRWVCIEFSTLGFIGKMFHSSDLRMISSILLTYFRETPCDLLLGVIIKFLGQKLPIHSPISLFQHIGKISSLRNKMMPSIDRSFKGIGSNELPIMKIPKGDHPPAKFETDMNVINGYPPENVYKNNSYFWASYPKSKQYFRIIFQKPLNISRLVISTGESLNKTDYLERGILKIGVNEKPDVCNNLTEIGNFVEGEFDSLIQGIAIPINVYCLHIEVKKGQTHWLMIRNIEIFRNKPFLNYVLIIIVFVAKEFRLWLYKYLLFICLIGVYRHILSEYP